MNNDAKLIRNAIITLICAIGLAWLAARMYHKTNTQDFNVVQSLTGEVAIRRASGIWFKFFPTVWTYPKASIEICSSQAKENDPFTIQFNNKSTAKLNCQVGYRLDNASDDQLIALHQEVEGSDDKIWFMVYTRLNNELQKVSTQFDPSAVIGGERFPEFEALCNKAVLHNQDLLVHGIDVNSFTIDGKPDPDDQTKAQFAKQREADLARRLAEATVKQLAAETEKERAEAARKTEHEKIEAQALMAKEKLDFERQKQNETIAAEKKLALAKIAKDEAEVKAQQEAEVAKIEAERQRVVAEIAKKTEAERLEMIKLQSEQKVAAAQAKQKEIELSGAITELQQAQLDLERSIAQYKWDAIGKGISGIKLPQMMNIGNGVNGESGVSPLDQLIQMMTVEKLNNIAPTAD